MKLKTKILLISFSSLITISLVVTVISIINSFSLQAELNRALYKEKITRFTNMMTDQDELYFEGAYDSEDEPKNKIIDFIRTIYRSNKNAKTFPFIFTDKGTIVAHPSIDRDKNFEPGVTLLKNIQNDKNEGIYKINNESMWCVFEIYKPWKWVVCYQIPVTLKNAKINQSIKIQIIAIVLCIAFFLPIIYLLLKFTLSPLLKINKNFKMIAEGEGDLTQSIMNVSNDEIGQLSSSFNQFVKNLQKMIRVIIDNANSVNNSTFDLVDISNLLGNYSQNMSTISTSIIESSKNISRGIEGVREKTTDSNSTLTSVSTAAEQLTATISEIAKNIEQSKNETLNAVKKVDRSVKMVHEFQTQAEKIVDIVSTVTEVAEQTKLLSVNATIQAARAGDAGKQFAVVAYEIRELALTTGQSAHDINQIINDIRNSISSTAEDISEIKTITENINDTISNIAASIEEQSVTTREISKNISYASRELNSTTTEVTNLAQSVKNITQETEQSNETICAVEKKSVQLRDKTDQFAHLSSQLLEQVDKFKI